MFRSLSLGRPFGVEIRLHWTLLMLLLFVAMAALIANGLIGSMVTLLLVGSVLFSVTLHELGHIAAAHVFGIGTTGVTLYPFGGIARLTREANTPLEEIVVALAGPLVNVVLAGLAAIPLVLFGSWWPLQTFLLANCALAAFNLIPAYPMDGGRVLRGALWRKLGLRRATHWAARAGQSFAVLFGLLALLFAHPILFLVAVVVFSQASAELTRLRLSGAYAEPRLARPWVIPPQEDPVGFQGPRGAPSCPPRRQAVRRVHIWTLSPNDSQRFFRVK